MKPCDISSPARMAFNESANKADRASGIKREPPWSEPSNPHPDLELKIHATSSFARDIDNQRQHAQQEWARFKSTLGCPFLDAVHKTPRLCDVLQMAFSKAVIICDKRALIHAIFEEFKRQEKRLDEDPEDANNIVPMLVHFVNHIDAQLSDMYALDVQFKEERNEIMEVINDTSRLKDYDADKWSDLEIKSIGTRLWAFLEQQGAEASYEYVVMTRKVSKLGTIKELWEQGDGHCPCCPDNGQDKDNEDSAEITEGMQGASI